MDLSEFSELTFEMLYCKRCPLHLGRTCVVPGAGARNPELFFVGEGPGEDEDKQGLPFVGRSGKLLTSAIAAAGLTREQVFISNIVKCRPPNNRDPLPEEVAACMPYLHKQIQLLSPKVVVAVGRIAATQLLGREVRITKERGKLDFLSFSPDILVSIVYHPSYVLRNRHTRIEEDFFQDILHAREIAYGDLPTAGVFEGNSG